MKITIEGTVEELKEFGIDKDIRVVKHDTIINIVVITEDGITTEGDWITFRYKGREWSLYNMNERKEDGDIYFTYDEAIEFCKELEDRHLPSIEERQELLRAWCEWKGYKMDGNGVYGSDNDSNVIGKEFAKDFRLPLAGYRSLNIANVNNQGLTGYYWSSSPNSASSDSARRLYLDSSSVRAHLNIVRADGFSVRCFKNSYGS